MRTLKNETNNNNNNNSNNNNNNNNKLVYVIGLHAFQFGNNWMKKITRTAKIWLSEEFFESNIISKLDKHVASYLLLI